MKTLELKNIRDTVTKSKKNVKHGGPLLLRDYHKIKRWDAFDINKHWNKIEDVGRFMQNLSIRLGPFDGIQNAFNNQPVFVVGGSIAGRGLDLRLLAGKHTIGVNHMIEYWDGFEWFIFQDQRFLRKTTYDLSKFKGKIFALNSSQIDYAQVNDLVFFKSARGTSVNMNIEQGLYHRSLTGICALHLAIISGANPIYLIGLDTSKDMDENKAEETGLHYSKDYTGEEKLKLAFNNINEKIKLFKSFLPWKNRIINVCENGRIDWFKQISLNNFIESVL